MRFSSAQPQPWSSPEVPPVPCQRPNAEPPNTNCIAGRMNADGSCYYKNCTEAKANGECDIPEGSSHYCSKQDRDGDGIACEC